MKKVYVAPQMEWACFKGLANMSESLSAAGSGDSGGQLPIKQAPQKLV